MLGGSEVDKEHAWGIAITEFLVFALFSFVTVSRHGVFMSNTADQRIFADGFAGVGTDDGQPGPLER